MSGSVDVSKAFASPKLLVSRAYKHIGDVVSEVIRLNKCETYTGVVEYDPQTGQDVHKVRITGEPTATLNTIVKDAAANLRDALDHAVYACALSLNGGDPKNTAFPIGNTSASIESELKGGSRLKGVPAEIHPLLIAFRPYERVDGLMFGLNQIRNPNTHRAIITSV